MILALFGALHKLAEPGIHGKEAEEAEGCAGGGELGTQCSDVGGPRAESGNGGGVVEELVKADLEGLGFGLQVSEEVEGVVEGREEGAEATGGSEESVVYV